MFVNPENPPSEVAAPPDGSSDGIITYRAVIVKNIYGVENPGRMKIITRTAFQVFKRTLKRSGKIVGVVLLILPVALFVHLLLLIEIFALLTAGGLFLWGLGDRVLFEYVNGECPTCKVERHLTPYGSGRLKFPLTVHCAECGGTFDCIPEGN